MLVQLRAANVAGVKMTAIKVAAIKAAAVLVGFLVGSAIFAGPAAAETPLTDEERALLAQVDPSDQQRFELQERIQENAELAALLSELAKQRHETAKSIIDNIR